MECKDCRYFWCDEGETIPKCHFEGFWLAPCEDDDYEWDEFED